MLWLILGILTALFFALIHIVSKYAAEKADPSYLSNAIWIIYSLLVLPLVILFWPKLIITTETFLGFIIIGLIIFSTKIIYLNSLKLGTLSKTVPLLSVTPVFTLIIGMIWLGEFPKVIGVLGIMVIVFGTYLLNIEHFKTYQIFGPISAVFEDKASKLMIIVAFAYGFGSVVDKFVINHSNVISRVILFSYFTVFFNTMYLLIKDKNLFILKTKNVFRFWKIILLIDVFYLSMLLCQMYGLTLTYTAYIISLKRIAAVFSIIIAYFIFKEKKNFWIILSGTILMVIGAFLIIL